jgi:hypothetical protein
MSSTPIIMLISGSIMLYSLFKIGIESWFDWSAIFLVCAMIIWSFYELLNGLINRISIRKANMKSDRHTDF